MRTSAIERNTLETQIALTLNLDGTGSADVKTGCGFLDHMLTLCARGTRGAAHATASSCCPWTRRWCCAPWT